MMPQMLHIILRDKAEGQRLIAPSRQQGLQKFWSNARHDMREVRIVGIPERYEVGPVSRLIILRLHPKLLCVAVSVEVSDALLRPHETLVVVGC